MKYTTLFSDTCGGLLVDQFCGPSGGYVIQYPNSVSLTPLSGSGVGVGDGSAVGTAVGVAEGVPPVLPPPSGTVVGVAVTGGAVGVAVGCGLLDPLMAKAPTKTIKI